MMRMHATGLHVLLRRCPVPDDGDDRRKRGHLRTAWGAKLPVRALVIVHVIPTLPVGTLAKK